GDPPGKDAIVSVAYDATLLIAQGGRRMPRRVTSTPKPGRPVRGSKTGRPIMALLDLLGRRWALGVIWQLRDKRLTFRELQKACGGVSPTVLNQRLRELRESHLIDLVEGEGYGLTSAGRELRRVLEPLVAWSKNWAHAARGAILTAPAPPA